ncbi:MAG: hypothetical protein H7252_02205 [Cytophaga sp.]|nr:hypothetical protein [Undibacterium sp.]
MLVVGASLLVLRKSNAWHAMFIRLSSLFGLKCGQVAYRPRGGCKADDDQKWKDFRLLSFDAIRIEDLRLLIDAGLRNTLFDKLDFLSGCFRQQF